MAACTTQSARNRVRNEDHEIVTVPCEPHKMNDRSSSRPLGGYCAIPPLRISHGAVEKTQSRNSARRAIVAHGTRAPSGLSAQTLDPFQRRRRVPSERHGLPLLRCLS